MDSGSSSKKKEPKDEGWKRERNVLSRPDSVDDAEKKIILICHSSVSLKLQAC
jgi:hypothetical protein